MTFADAAEKVRDGDIGHSQVAITDVSIVPAERLHPKAAYLRKRPIPSNLASTSRSRLGFEESNVLRNYT